jgi:hypothetical protein
MGEEPSVAQDEARGHIVREDQAGGHIPPAPSEAGQFWRSLPGILTAAGSFLAGLAAVGAIVFGGKQNAVQQVRDPTSHVADATPQVRDAAAQAAVAGPPATNAPAQPADTAPRVADAPPQVREAPSQPAEAAPPVAAADSQFTIEGVFLAARTSDGYIAMRVQPGRDSRLVTKILGGQPVRCGKSRPSDDGPWRWCRNAEGYVGYMSDQYLLKL